MSANRQVNAVAKTFPEEVDDAEGLCGASHQAIGALHPDLISNLSDQTGPQVRHGFLIGALHVLFGAVWTPTHRKDPHLISKLSVGDGGGGLRGWLRERPCKLLDQGLGEWPSCPQATHLQPCNII